MLFDKIHKKCHDGPSLRFEIPKPLVPPLLPSSPPPQRLVSATFFINHVACSYNLKCEARFLTEVDFFVVILEIRLFSTCSVFEICFPTDVQCFRFTPIFPVFLMVVCL